MRDVAFRFVGSFGFQRVISIVLLVFTLQLGAQADTNTTVKPTELMKAEDCTKIGSTSCLNCTAYSNCIWCFAESFCADSSKLDKRGACEEDDWYRGDCDKPKKEQTLLYVLLACALFLLVIVVILVLYIFCWKLPREQRYMPLETDDMKIRRQRTPLMSKKFEPVASRTDELKKKYGLE